MDLHGIRNRLNILSNRMLQNRYLIAKTMGYIGIEMDLHVLQARSQSLLSWVVEQLRNATEITSPPGLLYRPSSALRQQLHSWAMRLLSRLEYERSFSATWGSNFVRIPKRTVMNGASLTNTLAQR